MLTRMNYISERQEKAFSSNVACEQRIYMAFNEIAHKHKGNQCVTHEQETYTLRQTSSDDKLTPVNRLDSCDNAVIL